MRIGLISDIHGNLVALDTVLVEIYRAGVDQIICLGDLAVMGPQPGDVIDRIRSRGINTILGNTDAWLVPDLEIPVEPPTSEPAVALTKWTAGHLSDDQINFLRQLPIRINIAPAPGISCIHATPDSLDDITHASAPIGGGESAHLWCCGHTHIQAMWRAEQHIWVNPGSVGLPGIGPDAPGLPRNRNVNWAEFAIVDVGADGRTEVSLRRIPLDMESVLQAAETARMPHQDWWRALWVT
jgi:predicted phosphodiesterase